MTRQEQIEKFIRENPAKFRKLPPGPEPVENEGSPVKERFDRYRTGDLSSNNYRRINHRNSADN